MFGRTYKFTRKIKDSRYDKSSGQLSIMFDAGISKIYLDVPLRVYDDFSKAPDPNQYYQDKIDGQFRIL